MESRGFWFTVCYFNMYCRQSRSWLDVRPDVRRSSSSLPAVCSSRDQPDRKSGVALKRQNQQQQSTDSAISVSLEDIEVDDRQLSTSSSTTSSRLSLLHVYATPTVAPTSGHVTHLSRLRRGMTLSGDDLFPACMRSCLLLTTCPLKDDNNNDNVTKSRDKPRMSTPDTAVIHLVSPPVEQQEKELHFERIGRLNVLIRRRLRSELFSEEDSGKSTSEDYTSDYEDSGRARSRWKDENAAVKLLPRLRDVRKRRSYNVTRRRRDVKRSQSDSVRVSRSNGQQRRRKNILLKPSDPSDP